MRCLRGSLNLVALVFILDALYERGNALHLLRRANTFQFQGKHGEVNEHGQDHNRPAVIVHPALVDEAQAKEKRFGNEGEPSEVHQGIQGGIFGAQHLQVFRPHEHPKGQRLRLRLPLTVRRAGWAYQSPSRSSPWESRSAGQAERSRPENRARRFLRSSGPPSPQAEMGRGPSGRPSVSIAPRWSNHRAEP